MNESLIQSALKHANFNLVNIIASVALVGIAVFLFMIFKRIYHRYSEQQERETGSKPNPLVFTIIRIAVIVLVALAVLQINGINVSSLIAGLGIASAIFGLALQDYLKDVIMGMHIMRDNYFQDGDIVTYNGMEGLVVNFNMRTTKIRSLATGQVLSVSNRNISEIEKMPDSQLQDIDIGLPYEEEPVHILSILEEAADEIRSFEDVDACEVRGIQAFADSAITYRVRFFCYPPKKFLLRHKANRTIVEHLYRNGVQVPFPQVDVHMK